MRKRRRNGNHGESRMMSRNHSDPKLCAIEATHRILTRFVRLQGRMRGRPVAIHKGLDGRAVYLTDAVITETMQNLASVVYKLVPGLDKIKWSSHSLRVGACVLLHSNGFQDYQIRHLLRWKSNAFMAYLRNVTMLTTQVNEAIMNSSAYLNLP